MRVAHRFDKPGRPYDGLTNGHGKWNGVVRFIDAHLDDPLHWRTPKLIFVNSMSDLFHESLTDGQILRIFDVMFRAPWHTYQILTKRPERALDWLRKWHDVAESSHEPLGLMDRTPADVRRVFRSGRAHMFASMIETWGEPPPGAAYPAFDWMEGMRWWPSLPMLGNIWIGFSAEDQDTFDARWTHAREWARLGWPTWVSLEPLLNRVDVSGALWGRATPCADCPRDADCDCGFRTARELGEPTLGWVVAGGESGPKARPPKAEWARELRDVCNGAGVPFLWKQWGEWAPPGDAGRVTRVRGIQYTPGTDETPMVNVGKKAAGRLLDGVLHDAYPEGMQHAA